MKRCFHLVAFIAILVSGCCQNSYQPISPSLGSITLLDDGARTFSVSPENLTAEAGKGGMAVPSDPKVRNVNNASSAARNLGEGWKVNPYVSIDPGETFVLADLKGSGMINHIWMTPTGNWHTSIIRIYWDGEQTPSVECPIGDFFCMGWGTYAPVSSMAVCVNAGSAFNCYWQMPFRKSCKITMENINPDPEKGRMNLYFQIDGTWQNIDKRAAYLHVQHRMTLYDEDSCFTILDGVKGKGQYVGTYFAIKTHNTGWWGEGEIKFFIDQDDKYPTICGTGTEDYFCGSYNFDRNRIYTTYNTPYAGMCQVIPEAPAYLENQKLGMYRWHITDPIRFRNNLKVTIQDLGWQEDGAYLAQHSQIATTAFWYQSEPHAQFPALADVQSLMAD